MKKSKQILKLLKAKGCSAAIFTDAVNIRYVSGFNAPDGVVIITKDRAVLFVDPRYNGIEPERDGEVCELVVTNKPLLEEAYVLLYSAGIKKIAYDTAALTYDNIKRIKAVFDDIKCVGISGICREMRASKDLYELDMIKKAQSITDAAFEHILGLINPDMTENELAAELEYFIRRRGAGLAFATIAVSGVMSAIPHGTPRDVRIGTNTFVTMDFGASWNGYCSDMTRTIAIGSADEEMRNIYNIVLEAQIKGIEAVKAGIEGCEADTAARSFIESHGHGQYFTHSLGHSLGLEIHEAPGFSRQTKSIIPENAVISVEPGIYIPGKYGVRIEDIVIVKENGAINLTKSPKELIII